MGQVDGKVVFITGAARGMGAAEARLLAREGASVIVADILGPQAEETAARIRSDGGTAAAVALDVSSEHAWAAAVERAEQRFGRIDALVNNAGVSYRVGLMDGRIEDWDRVISINVVTAGTALHRRSLRDPCDVRGLRGGCVDMLDLWRQRAVAATGAALPCGHTSRRRPPRRRPRGCTGSSLDERGAPPVSVLPAARSRGTRRARADRPTEPLVKGSGAR